ncbi:PqqD family protein [Candidatus Entotheonella palauensis]|uniref:PqqD family protein n=1 Tax=Candidatus Entotheonella palauensis TaxID=93172 RepID=UPI000B7F3FE2
MIHISSTQRVRALPHVLVRELDGESILLDLDSECYFGLDTIGTYFWTTLCQSTSTEVAYHKILETYEVEAERLRHDLEYLIDTLAQHGLVKIHHDAERS